MSTQRAYSVNGKGWRAQNRGRPRRSNTVSQSISRHISSAAHSARNVATLAPAMVRFGTAYSRPQEFASLSHRAMPAVPTIAVRYSGHDVQSREYMRNQKHWVNLWCVIRLRPGAEARGDSTLAPRIQIDVFSNAWAPSLKQFQSRIFSDSFRAT